jgi:hypothetical protein
LTTTFDRFAMATVMNSDATMTTTSMTMASSSPSAVRTAPTQETRDEAIQKMQSNLIRYARANDRRMVLRSLKDVKFLSSILLDPVQPADGPISELENEVAEETVILNGIPFKSVGLTSDGKPRGSGTNSSMRMIKALCSQLCDRSAVTVDDTELFEKLVVRMARSTSSADSYFRLNSLLGSPDLLVMPLSAENRLPAAPKSLTTPQKSISALTRSNSADKESPIHLNVYESNGDIHVNLSITYAFGLFRKNDVKAGRPWILLDAVVHERTNVTNDQSVRTLNVKLPDLY